MFAAAKGDGQVVAFAGAVRSYWLGVFPQVRRELRSWQIRAAEIPDPALRQDALSTLRIKSRNSEGAAAFATLAPKAYRRNVTRALVAFQLLADYLDTTSERPADDVFENTRLLHRAFDAALGLAPSGDDYYALHSWREDGGFLATLIDICRRSLVPLPAYSSVEKPLHRFVECFTETQCINHASAGELTPETARRVPRTRAEIKRHGELEWGEVVAAGASTLPVLSLIATASVPTYSESEAELVGAAYYPWPSALHILLDSLIDRDLDREDGQLNQLSRYPTDDRAADRLELMACRSRRLVSDLRHGGSHMTILAGLGGYYTAQPEAWAVADGEIARRVLKALGGLTSAAWVVHHLRQSDPGAALSQLRRRQPTAA